MLIRNPMIRSVTHSPKPFSGMVTKLSPSEQKMLRYVDTIKCSVCGKEISFSGAMTRTNYHYKITHKGKTKYYCGFTHMQAGRMRGD